MPRHLLLCLLLAACAPPPEPATTPATPATPATPVTPTTPTPAVASTPERPLPVMPRLRERPNAFMEALLTGTLQIQDGCLRVGASAGEPGHLVIWRPEYSAKWAGERLEIRFVDGSVVARVDEPIRMGGGEVPLNDSLEKQLEAAIPAHCKGPYWVMGELTAAKP